MYSVLSYGGMAGDGVRMDAYARAIERTVKRGDVVLDLGAGTGIMSVLAAKAGAKRVHAVDVNPAVWLARDLAAENGVGDRVEVHCLSSLELTLPEKVDVIVSDLRGSVGLHDEAVTLLRDARARLLKPDGILLPERDRLFVALVESTKLAQQIAHATVGFTRLGLTTRAAVTSMLNTTHSDGGSMVSASDVLSAPVEWGVIDFASPPIDVVESTNEVTIRRRGEANALVVWFEATIHADLGYSTAPGTATAYSRLLLPLLEPLSVEARDRASITLRANAAGDRWAWETRHLRGGEVKKHLRQATFLGMPTSAEALLRSSTSYKPTLSARGARTKRVLDLFDGTRSVSETTDLLSSEAGLPRAFVLDEVRDAVARYGR